MLGSRIAVVLLALVALPLSGRGLSAQGGTSLRWLGGEVGGIADGAVNTLGGNGPATRFQGQVLWVRLPFRGSILDPRIMNFHLTFTPTFRWSQASASFGSSLGRDLALDAGATFMASTRFPLDVFYTRNSATSENSYGGRTEFSGTVLGFTGAFRSRYVPATLRYRRRNSDRLWMSGTSGDPVLRLEDIGDWRFEAGSRKLQFFWTRRDYQEAIRNESFMENGWGLNHRSEWGKGSVLQSRFDTIDREGFAGYSRTSWSELLRIQHSRNISSQFQYGRYGIETSQGQNRIRSLSGSLNARIAEWVSADFNARRNRYARPDGSFNHRASYRPRALLRFEPRENVHVTSDLSVTLEDLAVSGAGGSVVDVFGEEHTVTRSRVVRLENRMPQPTSVFVFDESRTVLYGEGTDYRIAMVAGWIDLQILPTGRIQEDQSILVDYQYHLEEAGSSRSVFGAYSVSLAWSGLVLSHGKTVQDVHPMEGVIDVPLEFRDETWFRLSLSQEVPVGVLSVNAGYRSRKEERHPFSSKELQVQWVPPLIGDLQFLLFYSMGRTTNGSPGNGRRSRTASGSLTWPVTRTLTFRSGLDSWRWSREDGSSPEEFFGGWAGLAWRVGNTEADLRAVKNVRWAGSTGTARGQTRWTLRLLRRF